MWYELWFDMELIKALSKNKNLFDQFQNEILTKAQVICLNLNITNQLLSENYFSALLSCIQTLKNLRHLSLHSTMQRLDEVKEILKSLATLTQLHLNLT